MSKRAKGHLVEGVHCQSSGCKREPAMAIKTTDTTKGLTHTIYNDFEFAPKAASLHCLEHGARLAFGLACLSGPDAHTFFDAPRLNAAGRRYLDEGSSG